MVAGCRYLTQSHRHTDSKRIYGFVLFQKVAGSWVQATAELETVFNCVRLCLALTIFLASENQESSHALLVP